MKLFLERKLYSTLKKPVALLIELILLTGATPIDITNIQAKHLNRATKTLTLHINKKKTISTTTHKLSSQAIETFFKLEKTKPLSQYSIRRIQQLIKEETTRVGSALRNPRSLRREYLKRVISENSPHLREQTQLISLRQRTTLNEKDQKKLLKENYSSRNKTLILTLLQTGLRVNELLQLEARYIDKNILTIPAHISHNNTSRTISISQQLVAKFPQEGFLFTTNRNNNISQRRFEQICKEVGEKLSIKELTPSIIRATAIKNLSKQLSEEELLKQTGLGSSTLYTHSIFTSTTNSIDTTTTSVSDLSVERKDSSSDDADRFMYTRSKLKDGGDTDE